MGSGTYQFKLRPLRIGGDPDAQEDWGDAVLTNNFTLNFTD